MGEECSSVGGVDGDVGMKGSLRSFWWRLSDMVNYVEVV